MVEDSHADECPTHRHIPARPRGFIPFFDDPSGGLKNVRHGILPSIIRSETEGHTLGLPDELKHRASLAVPRNGSVRETGTVSDTGSDLEACQRAAERRSRRLIGQSNPRYHWEKYLKKEKELKGMSKGLRAYYERNNALIHQYLYIDKLLDSSIPHFLIQEYHFSQHPTNYDRADTVAKAGEEDKSNPIKKKASHEEAEEDPRVEVPQNDARSSRRASGNGQPSSVVRVKRTPRNLYSLPPGESTPLLEDSADQEEDGDEDKDGQGKQSTKGDKTPDGDGKNVDIKTRVKGTLSDIYSHLKNHDDDHSSQHSSVEEPEFPSSEFGGYGDEEGNTVKIAIYVNTFANFTLLILKAIIALLTNSLSVLASLVDAILDFVSTTIVWLTTFLAKRKNSYHYPTGRRKLGPLGVLVFAIIIIVSFLQVMLECFRRLIGPDHSIVSLSPSAIGIMASTVVVKGACWLYCHLIPDSAVQALAQDAITDVVFNIFSIIFPLVGYYASLWWLDPLGGLVLSIFVVGQWSATSFTHIQRLSGHAATENQRNVLLYLTMRFAESIKQVQGLQAYHAGDKLNVEVDIVLDEKMELKDSHDVAESLQYMLESVPYVDRAFVHTDYRGYNLATHLEQQADDS